MKEELLYMLYTSLMKKELFKLKKKPQDTKK